MVNTMSTCNVIYETWITGIYFIDPNEGVIDDAIEVECFINNNVEWTCIKPKQERYVRIKLT